MAKLLCFYRINFYYYWCGYGKSNRKKLNNIQSICLREENSKKSNKEIDRKSIPTELKCHHCKKAELSFIKIIPAMKGRSPPK